MTKVHVIKSGHSAAPSTYSVGDYILTGGDFLLRIVSQGETITEMVYIMDVRDGEVYTSPFSIDDPWAITEKELEPNIPPPFVKLGEVTITHNYSFKK